MNPKNVTQERVQNLLKTHHRAQILEENGGLKCCKVNLHVFKNSREREKWSWALKYETILLQLLCSLNEGTFPEFNKARHIDDRFDEFSMIYVF